ncbi:MAG: hypothetical protein IJK84_10715 [Bacteroidales bacterium]|nr:hypothetical protein [Bacteroidales bacterium]
MTQQEFETLYGKKVGENEFEIINAMYMLDDNETKQEFVARYKKMGKDELMDAFIRINDGSKKYTDGLNKQIKGLAERATVAEQIVTELKQDMHELLQMSVVYLHSYKTDLMLDVVREKMGTLNYYKELLAAGCTPTKADLEMFIKELEGTDGVKETNNGEE